MKAAVLDEYDKQERDLTVVEVPMPEMKADEVLVRVHTAGVNPLDNMIVRGEVKLIVPYAMPLIMGNEFCGTIEKMGEEAHGFSVGDRVYGRLPLNHIGAFAEYVAVSSDAVAKVPDYLSDEEATAVPLTALTALQALELLQVKSGDSVFISGGTGSFGAMAIPIAKSRGLKVITNGSAIQRDRVISLGADRFIDYRAEDYSKTLHDIDGIIDTLGERELPKEFGILKSGGHLVSLRGLPNGEFAKRMDMPFWKRMLFKLAGMKYDRMAAINQQHYHFIFVHEDGEGLQYTYKYPRPAVTADCIVITKEAEPKVLLIERGDEPFKGCWAFPGGFMNMDETTEQCAIRELEEETGLKVSEVHQIGAYSKVDCDPRGRTVTVAYLAIIDAPMDVSGQDDAAKAQWFPLSALPELAFDHDEIMRDAIKKYEEIVK